MLDKGLELHGKPLLQIGGQFKTICSTIIDQSGSVAPLIEEGLHTNLDYQFVNISEIDRYVTSVPSGKTWQNLDAKIVLGHLEPKYNTKYPGFDKRYPYGSVRPSVSATFDGVIVPAVHYGLYCLERYILNSNISMNPNGSFIESIKSSDLQIYVQEVAVGDEIKFPQLYDGVTGLPFVHASEETVEELIKLTGDNSFRYYEESYDPREIDPKSLITERVAVKCIVRPGKRKIDRRG